MKKAVRLVEPGGWILVGVAGFELATPCTPCKCATRLRYTPKGADYSGAVCVRCRGGAVCILYETVYGCRRKLPAIHIYPFSLCCQAGFGTVSRVRMSRSSASRYSAQEGRGTAFGMLAALATMGRRRLVDSCSLLRASLMLSPCS